jgi:hypothetical protein
MTEDTAKSPYRFSNPKQQAIYEQLRRLIGPGPAANFRDAWRLLDTAPPYETATNLVAHLLRETESALRAIIPPPPAPPIDTQLIALLEKHNVPADGPLGADLREYVRKNLRTGAHQASIKAVLQFLTVPADDPLATAWLETAESGNPYSLHRFAHRDNRNAPRPADNAFRTVCERFQMIFENVLDRFEAQYLKVVATIDELRKKPSPSDADLLVKILPNTYVAHEHLFTALDPAWLPLLHKKKFFTTPPPPIIDEEQGLISYVLWPAARYLTQIATHQPVQGLVAQILTEIPPTTNVRIHYDLCQAALALPPDLAGPWALQEAAWIEQQDFLPLGILALELAKLAVRLTEASKTTEAMSILRALLLPPTAPPEEENEPKRRRPPARIGEWEYQQVLEITVPALAPTSPAELLGLLVESLADALGGGNAERERREADVSYVWREAIDRDADRGIDGRAQGLVTALRDTSSQAIAKNPSLLPLILQLLDDRPGALYQRSLSSSYARAALTICRS